MTWEDVIVAGLLGTSTGGAGEDSAGSAITDSLLSWNGPSSRLSSFMAGNEASSDSTLPSGLNRGGGTVRISLQIQGDYELFMGRFHGYLAEFSLPLILAQPSFSFLRFKIRSARLDSVPLLWGGGGLLMYHRMSIML